MSGGALVTVIAAPAVSLEPGGRAEARVAIAIAPGYHVQANPASDRFLTPLRLRLRPAKGVVVEEIRYPKGVPYHLEGADAPLITYGGEVELKVTLSALPDAAPGRRLINGRLQYQGCDARSCLFPASIPVTVDVEIADPLAPQRRDRVFGSFKSKLVLSESLKVIADVEDGGMP